MFKRQENKGLTYFVSSALEAAGALHAFSTRLGGVSQGPFSSLNFGNPTASDLHDDESNLNENYRRLHDATGLKDYERLWVFQSHSATVVEPKPGQPLGYACPADGLISDAPRTALAMRSADCAPVLACNTETGRIGAFHIGWRGAAQGLATTAVQKMGKAETTIFAIGPCIGAKFFEVGPEVVHAFSEAPFHPSPFQRSATAPDKWLFDLSSAIRQHLESAGVPPDHIDESRLCTYENQDLFFSHRRDGLTTGRMVALIGRR